MNTKQPSLSRAEVNRRIKTLTVNPWKDLSGEIDGCHVNAWATGARQRISRISVYSLPRTGNGAPKAMALARKLHAATGLTVHFNHVWLAGVFEGGNWQPRPHVNGPRRQLPA